MKAKMDYKMGARKIEEIDAIILEEKRTIARAHFSQAWDQAQCDGIDAEIVARELIHGALIELAGKKGDKEAAKMVAEISSMEANGEFLLDKTLQ